MSSYRAEILKLRKRSAVWVLFSAGLILSLIFGYLLPYLGYVTGDDNPQTTAFRGPSTRAACCPPASSTTRSAASRSSRERSRWCSARS